MTDRDITTREEFPERRIGWTHAEHLESEAVTLEEIATELSDDGDVLTAIKLRGTANRIRLSAEGVKWLGSGV